MDPKNEVPPMASPLLLTMDPQVAPMGEPVPCGEEQMNTEVFQRSDDPRSLAAVSTKRPSAAVPSDWSSLFVHSVVLTVVISVLLSYYGGEPVLSGWSMSLFVVLYLFCISCSFSTPATPLIKTFIAISYVGLVAYLAGSLVSGVLGMVFMYLDSILAAGLFGSILAQHRQSKGSDRTALVAVTKAPAGKYRKNVGAYFFLGLLSIFCSVNLVCTMLPNSGYDAMDVAINLFGGLGFILFIYTICVLGWLNGAVYGDDSTPPVVVWYAIMAMLFFASFALSGKLLAANILWLCILVSTAFLGYLLRIHASYEHMMIVRGKAASSSTADSAAPTAEGSAAPTAEGSSAATSGACAPAATAEACAPAATAEACAPAPKDYAATTSDTRQPTKLCW